MDKEELEKRVKAAVKTVNSWPKWKRDFYNFPYTEEEIQKSKEEEEVFAQHRRSYSFWP